MPGIVGTPLLACKTLHEDADRGTWTLDAAPWHITTCYFFEVFYRY